MTLYREPYRLPRRGPATSHSSSRIRHQMGTEGNRYPALSGNGPPVCNLAFLYPNKTPNVHQGPPLSGTIQEWPSGPQLDTGSQRPEGTVPVQIHDAQPATLQLWRTDTRPPDRPDSGPSHYNPDH